MKVFCGLSVLLLGLHAFAWPLDAHKVPTPMDFTEPIIMPTGTSPYFVVAADFNKDGFVDLATSNTVSHDITIFINKGNGTFKEGVRYPTTGFTPYALAAADVNGDGYVDIVCGNMFSGFVSILLNKGDGTFETAKTVPVDAGPMFTVLADFNNDGKLDIATCNIGHDDITILLNQGDMTFKKLGTFKTGGVVPYSMVAADFDGDGNVDLATGNIYSANVSVLRNLGGGKFAEAVTYKTDSLTQILYVADFNHDGHPDIVTGNGGSDNVSVLINDGHGKFLPPVNYAVKLPQGVTAGDINNDGFLDIATANQSANTTSILLNKGDGTFAQAIDFPVGGLYPIGVVLVDLNNDGRLDLVTANSGSNNISIFLNGVHIPKVQQVTPSSGSAVPSRSTGELLRPMRIKFTTDIDPTTLNANTVHIYGSQSGHHQGKLKYDASTQTLEIVPSIECRTTPSGRCSFQAGENVKIRLTSGIHSTKGISLSGYTSTFLVEPRSPSSYATLVSHELTQKGRPELLNGLVAADLDGDGKIDLVALEKGSDGISLYYNGPEGLSQSPEHLSMANFDPIEAIVEDFNNDGLPDIAVLGQASSGLSIFFNQGGRQFSKPYLIQLPGAYTSIAAIDFNADGLMDLALTSPQNRDIAVLLNDGNMGFKPAIHVPADATARAVASADFDRDGLEDVAIATAESHSIIVFRNDAGRTFAKKEVISLSDDSFPSVVMAADFNLDGAPDLLALDSELNKVAVITNKGDGTFGSPEYLELRGQPKRAVIADLNGDGWPDLIISYDKGLSVFMNHGGSGFQSAGELDLSDPNGLVAADIANAGLLDFVLNSNGHFIEVSGHDMDATSTAAGGQGSK